MRDTAGHFKDALRPYGGYFADSGKPVVLSPGCDLTLPQLVAVARGDGSGRYAPVILGGDWKARCQRSAAYVQHAVSATMGRSRDELALLTRSRFVGQESDDPDLLATRALIYGVTTGFGYFKSRPLSSAETAAQIQLNILRSHATGVGAPLPTEVVRAMMLLRLRTFVEGCSGIRPALVELLAECLNRRVHPWVPEQGSVGSSGDLCPLAHLALVLIGEGLAWHDEPSNPLGYGLISDSGEAGWDVRLDRRPSPKPARKVLEEAGLASMMPKELHPKEGLALTNGTAATTAIAALAVYDSAVLYGCANVSASLSLQALCGFTRALDPKVHRLRRHLGQQHAAAQILNLCFGSRLVDQSSDVQDSYSLRCAPAVHGAALSAIDHAWEVIEGEANAVTDNPLFFDGCHDGPPCDGYAACIWDAYSAGNFHGAPVGLAADYLKIAVADLASISERRLQCMLDEHHSRGLPANLWPDRKTAGLNSGLMIVQYAAASLVSENKVLSHPASVDSIPTSSNIEDHVAMATIAARHARMVVANARNVLASELLSGLQALDLRLRVTPNGERMLSPAAAAVREAVRSGSQNHPVVAMLENCDDVLWPSVAAMNGWVGSGDLLRVALAGCRE